MESIDFIREILNSKWINDYGYEYTLVAGEKVKPNEFYILEKELNIVFPKDFIQVVSEIGLCRLDARWEGKGDPGAHYSMLSPGEIREIITAYKKWTDDYTYFDENDEEEQEIKKIQQSIRDTLIPFQYYGDGTEWDFYCFVPAKEKNSKCQVIIAYHDDDEIDNWFEDEDLEKVWGFQEHVIDWIDNTKES